ncbi:MAG: biopolymer transporter ExbD [Pseudomonadota bacterium]
MEFGTAQQKPRAESVVPMINVVFLLLIFFLMTATIAPSEPFEVAPPESRAEDPAEASQPLFVSAEGDLVWGELKDDAAVAAISSARQNGDNLPPLTIRADRKVSGQAIARLLKRLAGAGVTQSQLIAVSVE